MTTPERYRVAFYFDCGSGHIADAERGADRGGADGAKTTGSSQSNTDTHR